MAFKQTTCKTCGRLFKKEYNAHVYCSESCRPYRKKNPAVMEATRECKGCGKRFKLKRVSQYFCNAECSKLYHRRKRAIIKTSNCLQCGKEFIRTRKLLKYCSFECKKLHKAPDEPTKFPGFKPFECPFASGRLPDSVTRNTL